jgi:hypothetical protein
LKKTWTLVSSGWEVVSIDQEMLVTTISKIIVPKMLVLRRARRYLQLPDEAVASTGGGGT